MRWAPSANCAVWMPGAESWSGIAISLATNQTGNLQWGMSAAPLVVDDKVIVLPGGRPGKSVVAYNKDTGAPVWQALDDKQAYVSPMLVTLAGQRQILMVSAQRVAGLSPEDGKASMGLSVGHELRCQ